MAITPTQQTVVNEAFRRLHGKPWFSGVCTDDLPSDAEINKDFEVAVVQVTLNTAYWDAPGHGLKENF